MAARSRALACILVLASAGCTLENPGVDPPAATLNFPTSLLLVPRSGGGSAGSLLVANSNYTIRYNSGTLQSFDLDEIHRSIALCPPGQACTLGTDEDPAGPPESGTRPLQRYVRSEVGIGSHTSDLVLSTDRTRVYAAVRGERNLTFVDIDPETGELSCDQAPRFEGDELERCGEGYRAGDTTIASARRLELRGDPVAIAAGSMEDLGGAPGSGDFVLMALRGGEIALFIDDDVLPTQGDPSPPQLVHIADGFADQLVSIEIQPSSGLAFVASTTSRELGRAGIVLDGERSFVYDGGRVRLGAVDDALDLRDLRFHPTRPSRALALTRRPEAIVALDLDRTGVTPGDAGLWRTFEVGAGPSRMEVAEIGGRTYAFATCFDARKIFVVDVDAGELVAVIGGFSGPFGVAVDPLRDAGWLYVVDFSTSVLRVVDLSRLGSHDELEITATVGPLRPATQFGR